MTADELRINNLLEDENGKFVEVIAINSSEIATDNNEGYFPIYFFKPIPLTPAILEKVSIANTGWHIGAIHYDLDNDYSIRVTDTGWIGLVTNRVSWSHVKELKDYPLHKLQNLYNSLTDKELQIQL